MRQLSPFVRGVVACFLAVLFGGAGYAQESLTTEGSLHLLNADLKEVGLCPLKRTEVKADVSGFISRVTVTQTFQNPLPEAIEAVYAFPLPNDAAVDDMSIIIGDRIIRGRIMERQKAKETYDAAKQQGKTAALLEQQRPNVFTQFVANITSNAEIKVTISYVETLRYTDDAYEFTFPMTIGKRYMPLTVTPEEAAKLSAPSSARPGHTISMEINVEAGVPVTGVSSVSHEIDAQSFSASRFTVKLKDGDTIPNRDFVLRYKTAGSRIEDAVIAHHDERGGFFTLILQPPDKVMPADTMPKEIVFVLDTSGSMGGFPGEKSKEVMDLTLANLNPNDTFNLITFAGETRILFDDPVPASPDNVARARKLLAEVTTGGGTEMMKAIKAALEPSDSQNHIRIVCFMTDGEVGNDREIIGEIQKHPNARIFSFGIGTSINHYLLDEMAREGRGEVEYVTRNDDGAAAAKRFFERVRNPLLTDITLEYKGVAVSETYPQRVPDLFDAKPVAITGRYLKGGPAVIVLRGRMQGQVFSREINVDFPSQKTQNELMATLWARKKIADLTSQDATGKKESISQAITQLGLQYRMLTSFTSMVAVDETIVTSGGPPRRVDVTEAEADNSPPAVTGGQYPNYGIGAMVNVTSGGVETYTSSSTITTTTQTLELPVNGRSFQSLITFAPGTNQVEPGSGRISLTGLVTANGQRSTSNQFTIDGVDSTRLEPAAGLSGSGSGGTGPGLTASGGTNSLVPMAGVEEIRVSTLQSAKDGRTPGATIEVVTKSGSNAYQGSLFETFGNEALNAADPFAKARGFERAPSRLNLFGGTLGGYLKKDTAFFFVNYEGMRIRQSGFITSEVPSGAARLAAPPDLRTIFNAFPVSNGLATQGGFAEFSSVFANPASHDIFGFRLDANLNDNFRLTGRYDFSNSAAAWRGDRGLSLNTLRFFDTSSNALSLRAAYTATPNIIVSGFGAFRRGASDNRFDIDNFGGAVPFSDFSPTSLKYDLAGRAAIGAGGRTRLYTDEIQAGSDVTWIVGSHSLSFGAGLRRLSFDVQPLAAERNVLFGGLDPAGTAARINEIHRIAPGSRAATNFSFFGQDEWRASTAFSMTAGARWDMDFAPDAAEVATTFPDASARARNRVNNVAPRFGIAVDPFSNGHAVLRANVGLYYDFSNLNAAAEYGDSYPFATGFYTRSAPFDTVPAAPLRPLALFARDLKAPHTWKVSSSYEYRLFSHYTLSAGFMAAFGRNLLLARNYLNEDPVFNVIRFTGNMGRSDYQALHLQADRRLSDGFSFNVRYSFSRSTDNVSAGTITNSQFAADPSQDKGPSDFDARHTFIAFATYDLSSIFTGGPGKRWMQGWMLSGNVNMRSALPVNVTYAQVNDLGVEYYRPDLLSGVSPYTIINGLKAIDPAAFSVPAVSAQGSLERNTLRGFPLMQVNFSVAKTFKLSSESSLVFRAEAFNVFNTVNYENMSGNLGTRFQNSTFVPNHYFGRPMATLGSGGYTPLYLYGGPRTIQLSARVNF